MGRTSNGSKHWGALASKLQDREPRFGGYYGGQPQDIAHQREARSFIEVKASQMHAHAEPKRARSLGVHVKQCVGQACGVGHDCC